MTAALIAAAGVIAVLACALAAEVLAMRAELALEGQGRDACEAQLDQCRRSLREQHLRDTAQAAVIRGLQQAVADQYEIARVATDAAQSLTHEHARLIVALQEATAYIVGGRDERERLAALHRLDFDTLGHCGTAAALAREWHALIAECEAGAGTDAARAAEPIPPPPPLDQRHLRVVGGTAARPATASDRLHLTGPIGA